jgi:hypothetical protein
MRKEHDNLISRSRVQGGFNTDEELHFKTRKVGFPLSGNSSFSRVMGAY